MKLIKGAILLLPLLLLAAPLGQHSQGSTISKIPSSTSLSNSLEHLAQKAYGGGFYKQAISLLGKALKLDPNNPRVLTNLGSAENVLQNYSGAIIFYKKALEKDPHNVGALAGLGAAVYMLNGGGVKYFKEALREPVSSTVGKLEQALALTYLHNYTQVISILNQMSPSVDVLNSKAIILMDQKNYTGSLFYLKALKLSPHNPTIFYNMGLINMFLGNYGAAIDDYNHVLKIMPNDKHALYGKKLAIGSLMGR